MTWRHPGDKSLSESIMASLPKHVYVTRPHWVKEIDFSVWESLSNGVKSMVPQRCGSNIKGEIFTLTVGFESCALNTNLLSGKCHRTPLMIIVNISWSNGLVGLGNKPLLCHIELHLCYHMASPGHNELTHLGRVTHKCVIEPGHQWFR